MVLAAAGVTAAGFTASGLGVTALACAGLASAGFAATAFGLMCFFAGLASVCAEPGMTPGESCAGAGMAPRQSTSITRNGPQRIVSRHPDLISRHLSPSRRGRKHQEAGRKASKAIGLN